ncbi:MAG: hypothetical protein KAS66_00250 [Candidatus Omnitrophica bacterium]|nr:hypothetical protein [Candidatus Omnitrophota bacterium]
MIGTILLELGKIVLPALIENIFAAEKEHTSPRSGNTKRDVVHKAIIKMIIDEGIPFDASQLGDLIDAQVQVLKDNDIGWTLGAPIIKTIIERIMGMELNCADYEPETKLEYAQRHIRFEIFNDDKTTLDTMAPREFWEGFINDQVKLFNDFGLFTKKS